MGTFLDRYQQGDHVGTWHNLLNLGDDILQDSVINDAVLIATLTMERVKHNILMLIPRLQETNYTFRDESESYKQEQPIYAPPSSDVDDVIAEIEKKAGPMPLSIKYFYKIVGTVNLVGEHSNWKSCGHLDSLLVHPPKLALEWWNWNYEEGEESTDIAIAPDEYHKIGQSGAGVYSIKLPNSQADALLEGEWHSTTFIDYLRICFKWGGSPGLERCKNPPITDIKKLTQDILLF